MAGRAIVTLPPRIARGEVIEVRTLVAHPMETGHRVDAMGRTLPRDIVTRLEARLDDQLVFAADLHPAIAANPFVAFPLRAERSGTLTVTWRGDGGFVQRESVALVVA